MGNSFSVKEPIPIATTGYRRNISDYESIDNLLNRYKNDSQIYEEALKTCDCKHINSIIQELENNLKIIEHLTAVLILIRNSENS